MNVLPFFKSQFISTCITKYQLEHRSLFRVCAAAWASSSLSSPVFLTQMQFDIFKKDSQKKNRERKAEANKLGSGVSLAWCGA